MKWIVLWCAFMFGIFGCSPRSDQAENSTQNTRTKKSSTTTSERIIPVEGVQVKKAPINASIQAIAIVEAKEKATLRAFISGMVSDIKVEEGDQVKSDDILARLSRPGVSSLLGKARVALQQSQLEVKRLKKLVKKSVASREELTRAKFQSEQNRLELKRLQAESSHEKIKTPITGVVTQKQIYRGETVSPGQVLFEVIDTSQIRIPLALPEQWSHKLQVGLKVILRSRAGDILSDQAKISYVSPIIDAQTGTIKAFVSVPKTEHMRPGLYVKAEVILDEVSQALIVPKQALMYKNEQVSVLRVEKGIARVIAVNIGYEQDQQVQILDVLSEGDYIVTFGQGGIADGARVKLSVMAD